jgi:hypothetical protein
MGLIMRDIQYIECSDDLKNLSLKIYDISGKLLLQRYIPKYYRQEKIELNIKDFSQGVYIYMSFQLNLLIHI